jgi:hypothetical protein
MLVAGEGKATGLPKVRHKVTRSYLEEAATVRGISMLGALLFAPAALAKTPVRAAPS